MQHPIRFIYALIVGLMILPFAAFLDLTNTFYHYRPKYLKENFRSIIWFWREFTSDAWKCACYGMDKGGEHPWKWHPFRYVAYTCGFEPWRGPYCRELQINTLWWRFGGSSSPGSISIILIGCRDGWKRPTGRRLVKSWITGRCEGYAA